MIGLLLSGNFFPAFDFCREVSEIKLKLQVYEGTYTDGTLHCSIWLTHIIIVVKHPIQTYGYGLLFSISGYIGVAFVLSLVKAFGALIAVTGKNNIQDLLT